MKTVCILSQGDEVTHQIVDVFSSLYDAMVVAASTPTPDPFMKWVRDIDVHGNVVWKAGRNWMRVEEKIIR
jgi:hypothetical protein